MKPFLTATREPDLPGCQVGAWRRVDVGMRKCRDEASRQVVAVGDGGHRRANPGMARPGRRQFQEWVG